MSIQVSTHMSIHVSIHMSIHVSTHMPIHHTQVILSSLSPKLLVDARIHLMMMVLHKCQLFGFVTEKFLRDKKIWLERI